MLNGVNPEPDKEGGCVDGLSGYLHI